MRPVLISPSNLRRTGSSTVEPHSDETQVPMAAPPMVSSAAPASVIPRAGKASAARPASKPAPPGSVAAPRTCGRHEIGGHVLELVVDGIEFDVGAGDERKIVVVEAGCAGEAAGAFGRGQVGDAEYVARAHDGGSGGDLPIIYCRPGYPCVRKRGVEIANPVSARPHGCRPCSPSNRIRCLSAVKPSTSPSTIRWTIHLDPHVCCRPMSVRGDPWRRTDPSALQARAESQ